MCLLSLLGSKLFREEKLKLSSVIILFDRDFGTSFFQDFRGYGNLLDDAEWLLERTSQRSWGFMIRPVRHGECYGLWIGEYGPHINRVIREEIIFDERTSSNISRILFDYADHKVSEKKVRKKVTLNICKRRLLDSKIVQEFKYYTCPVEKFYKNCPHVKEIYKNIREKYGLGAKVHYSIIAEIISSIKPCSDVIICPLLSPPNAFERIINLNKALKTRKIGEIKFINQSIVEIT